MVNIGYNRFSAVTLSDEHFIFRVGCTDMGATSVSPDGVSLPESVVLPSSYSKHHNTTHVERPNNLSSHTTYHSLSSNQITLNLHICIAGSLGAMRFNLNSSSNNVLQLSHILETRYTIFNG